MTRRELTRRHAVTGAVLGVAGLAAACGDDSGDDSGGGTDTSPSSPDSGASPTSLDSGEAPDPSASDSSAEEEPSPVQGLVAAADVPVGGGVVLAEAKLVVTQPTRGTFKAFDATCTHMGCTVGSVDETIHCPCHGSSFEITDGSVAGGPAPSPLPAKKVRVRRGQVVLD